MAEHHDFFQSQTVKDFNREIAKYHLGPLWHAIPDLMNHEPKPHADAYLWKWEALEAKLMEAREIRPIAAGNGAPSIFRIPD